MLAHDWVLTTPSQFFFKGLTSGFRGNNIIAAGYTRASHNYIALKL